ncbi:methionyl-tRNA formyltransferase [Marinicrinis lubricantis]|uniref:Methionyl-tRNA formyltransferase n=1 Tax=Marinicrinis lubricantis TaxID=2086470 RepID=A0ABW1IMM8_9BACL
MTKQMAANILFMGTPDFAVPCLEALLHEGYSIKAVVTQPDRPKGRKKVLTPPPVKEVALKHGLPVLQPEKVKHALDEIAALEPDLIVTAAYGQILPKALLDLPRLGAINVHASLLPKYRGAAPIQYAIMNGDSVTGVTIMYMEEGLDTGDMISKVEIPIGREDDAGTMFDVLSHAGAKLLMDTLPGLLSGSLQAEPQNDEEATYAKTIKREDERIDWTRTSNEIYNHVRALSPWPGAFTTWNGEVFKIWSADDPEKTTAAGDDTKSAPGTVLQAAEGILTVRTGDGALRLKEIQPAGKKRMNVESFLTGKGIQTGTLLGGHEL